MIFSLDDVAWERRAEDLKDMKGTKIFEDWTISHTNYLGKIAACNITVSIFKRSSPHIKEEVAKSIIALTPISHTFLEYSETS